MNKKQISTISIITVLTIAMTLSPLGSGYNFNTVFAGGNDDDDGNRASQIIAQVQRSIQNSQVVSGGDSIGSGNNFNFQNQENEGNNALAQDSDDDGDGNSASQAIVQSQSSEQNSQVVSGGDSIGSGNNFNFQNQENEGNNAIGQQ
jgi:hypothetical protein